MKKKIFISIILSIFLVVGMAYARDLQHNKSEYVNAPWTFGKDVTFGADIDVNGAINGIVNSSTGNVFYVDSGSGDNSDGHGTTRSAPFATIDYAIGKCTADNGDTIIVMPGHAETIDASDEFDADVAGISIIGIGRGTDMPTLTSSETDGYVTFGAANITMKNIAFLAGADGVEKAISVEAAADDCNFDSLYFMESGATNEYTRGIVSAAGADRNVYQNCTVYSADAVGATNWLDLDTGVQNGTMVLNNFIYGEFAEGPIHSDDIDLDVYVAGNVITNLTTGQHCIEFSTTALGVLANNQCSCDTLSASYDPGSLKMTAPNYVTLGIDAAPVVFGASDGSKSTTVAGQTYVTSKVATAMADDLFDVAGGPILIKRMIGVVTTQLAGDGNNLSLSLDADSPWINKDFTTAVAVEGDTVGTYYVFVSNGGAESVLTPLAGASDGVETIMTPWFSGEGMIEQVVSDADCTGAITWYMEWTPLADGTTVTAQ